jgi:hypothetical protein
MYINPNVNINRFNNAGSVKTGSPKSPAVAQETATGSFDGASALESALGSVPDVRPEAVSRARELIADTTYPSPQTLRKVSDFLAKKLLSAEDNNSNHS